MALCFTLGLNGYGNINLVELKTRRVIKENATIIDLKRIRTKQAKRKKTMQYILTEA